MTFWLLILIAALTLFVNFALPQKTFRIRLTVLALGLLALVLTAERYREDVGTRHQIEQKLAPRNLTAEQMEVIAAKLRSLGSWTYDLSLPPTLEPGSLLDTELISTFKNAGWKLQSIQTDGPTTTLPPLKAIYAINLPSRLPGDHEIVIPNSLIPHITVGQNVGVVGVIIEWDKTGFGVTEIPVDELWQALTNAGIVTTTKRRSDVDSDILHVAIGSKP